MKKGVSHAMVVLGGLWLLLAGVGLWLRIRGISLPTCLFRRLTGHECSACGSTRAVARLLEGDVMGAIAMNPLAIALITLVPLLVVFHTPLRRAIDARRAWLWMTGFLVALIAANWWYVLTHPNRGEQPARVSEVSPADGTPPR